MEKEYRGLESAATFGEMKQPDGLNVISAKWVWPNEHGHVVRAKVRQVAQGFQERGGIIFFRLLPRRLLRLGFVCWVLLRVR